MILPYKGSDPQQILFYETQKKSSFLTFVPGPAVKTNRGYASLAKVAGWEGGRINAQSGVSGTKNTGLRFPRTSPEHRSFPGFLNAGVRACACTYTHTHTLGLARAQSTLRQPRQASLPPPRADAQDAKQEEGGANKKKKLPPPSRCSTP